MMRARMSGSDTVAKLPHIGHSKSPNSMIVTGALGSPRRYPSAGGKVASIAGSSVIVGCLLAFMEYQMPAAPATTRTAISPKNGVRDLVGVAFTTRSPRLRPATSR